MTTGSGQPSWGELRTAVDLLDAEAVVIGDGAGRLKWANRAAMEMLRPLVCEPRPVDPWQARVFTPIAPTPQGVRPAWSVVELLSQLSSGRGLERELYRCHLPGRSPLPVTISGECHRKGRWRSTAVLTIRDAIGVCDPLTGLANRRAIEDRIARMRGESTERLVGVFFIDIDCFKEINERYGHLVGDEVLAVTASRLAAALRAEDTVARVGGDEFVAICAVTTPTDAIAIADRLREAATPPMELGEQTISLTVSVGVAVVSPESLVKNPAAALEEADRALFAAKYEHASGSVW